MDDQAYRELRDLACTPGGLIVLSHTGINCATAGDWLRLAKRINHAVAVGEVEGALRAAVRSKELAECKAKMSSTSAPPGPPGQRLAPDWATELSSSLKNEGKNFKPSKPERDEEVFDPHEVPRALKAIQFLSNASGVCGCIRCQDTREASAPEDRPLRTKLRGPAMFGWRYACEVCGNKRCPHHSDHDFKCTGSNEPEQRGVR
jgi:hypothetical protein